MHAKSPSLDAVRARIDAVDAALLRLVDERAALAREVAEAKRAAGDAPALGLKPAREAVLIRGLLAAPGRSASPQLTVRLWREFISDSLVQQGPFHLIVWGGEDPARTVELARLRFGAAPPLARTADADAALQEAKTPGGVAVLALGSDLAWWDRLLDEPALAAFATLPCLHSLGPQAALAVASIAAEPTGEDESYWASDAADAAPALAAAGFEARPIASAESSTLFALAGFVEAADARLAGLPGRRKGLIGAAPLPFDP